MFWKCVRKREREREREKEKGMGRRMSNRPVKGYDDTSWDNIWSIYLFTRCLPFSPERASEGAWGAASTGAAAAVAVAWQSRGSRGESALMTLMPGEILAPAEGSYLIGNSSGTLGGWPRLVWFNDPFPPLVPQAVNGSQGAQRFPRHRNAPDPGWGGGEGGGEGSWEEAGWFGGGGGVVLG